MSAYQQGCEAARKWWMGGRITTRHQVPPTNPHEPGSDEFDQWHKGYTSTLNSYQSARE